MKNSEFFSMKNKYENSSKGSNGGSIDNCASLKRRLEKVEDNLIELLKKEQGATHEEVQKLYAIIDKSELKR